MKVFINKEDIIEILNDSLNIIKYFHQSNIEFKFNLIMNLFAPEDKKGFDMSAIYGKSSIHDIIDIEKYINNFKDYCNKGWEDHGSRIYFEFTPDDSEIIINSWFDDYIIDKSKISFDFKFSKEDEGFNVKINELK